MRIINESKKVSTWSLRIMCNGCGSILEVEKEDIYRTECSYYNGEKSICYTTVCPKCGKETDISRNLLPFDVIYECEYVGSNNRQKVLSRFRHKKHRWF